MIDPVDALDINVGELIQQRHLVVCRERVVECKHVSLAGGLV